MGIHFTLPNVLNSPDLGKSIHGPNEKPPHTSHSSPSPHSPLTPLHSLTAIPPVAGALPLGLGGSSLYHAHCTVFSTGSTLPASPPSLASSWARAEPWSWHSCFSCVCRVNEHPTDGRMVFTHTSCSPGSDFELGVGGV